MGTIINGYRLLKPLNNDNSGCGRWGFAEKDGIEVFIKEFLSPVYPMDEALFSEEQLANKRRVCQEFVKRKFAFYKELKKCTSGNIVAVLDFFRYKTKFYIVTEKVDNKAIPPEEVYQMPVENKLLLAKVISISLNELHSHSIVHGDIKPSNILFKKTKYNTFTAKIIDFDSSFFADETLDVENDFQGDLVYLAPESFLLMMGEDIKPTTKIDVFALGVLYCQYFTGSLPLFPGTESDYTFEAVLNDGKLDLSANINSNIRELLESMLSKDPGERPDLEIVTNTLTEIINGLKDSDKQGKISRKFSFRRAGKLK